MNRTIGERIFSWMNAFILILISIICIYPFIYVFSASISSGNAVVSGDVLLFPKEINFQSYVKVVSEPGIWKAYGNTFFYTFVGTACNLLFTICGAYPLSKRRLMGGPAIAFFIAFTMWFNAGLIPMYLNFESLGLVNTRTSIIIGFAITTFLVFILRTFFQSVPDSLEEAAKIDGANDLQILKDIYLPLATPALITVGLFYAVSRWNGYFWTMILLSDESKIPLQVLLKKLIVEMNVDSEFSNLATVGSVYSQQTIIYATIIISIIPIIIVYPFLQKYFAQGAMVGSIKE